jgi:hypothetical protein
MPISVRGCLVPGVPDEHSGTLMRWLKSSIIAQRRYIQA